MTKKMFNRKIRRNRRVLLQKDKQIEETSSERDSRYKGLVRELSKRRK
jgi:hypothetical protein